MKTTTKQTPWNKGKKGVQIPYWLGKHMSDETKLKISYSKLGQVPWNKGTKGVMKAWNKGLPKEMQPHYDRHLSEQAKKEISERISGSNNGSYGNPAYNRGITHSPQVKERIREKIRKLYANGKLTAPFKGKHLYPHTIELIKEKRMHQVFPLKDTSIERKIQQQLNDEGLEFEKHKAITGQPDIFLPPHDKHYKGIALFADGDYWHNLEGAKERDTRVNTKLLQQGYYVVRLPENHINEKNFNVVKYVKEIVPTEHLKREKVRA